jgi:hypothetical protein
MRAGVAGLFLVLSACADATTVGEQSAAASSPPPPAFVPTWVKSIGGINSQFVNDLFAGSQRSFIAGTWRDELDFHDGDKRLSPTPDALHPYLAAIDANGRPIWLRSFSQDFEIIYSRIAATAEEDIVTVGFGPPGEDAGCGMIPSSGIVSGFIAKYDGATGLCLWMRSFTSFDEGNLTEASPLSELIDVKVEPNGDIIVVGQFVGSLDLGDGVVIHNLNDRGGESFVARLDPRGHALWARLLGNPNLGVSASVGVQGLTMDADGRIYLLMRARGAPLDLAGIRPDWDPTVNVNCVLALRGDGQFRWLYPRNERERAPSGNQNLTVDAIDTRAGRLAVLGRFASPFEFGGTTYGANDMGLFVLDFGLDGHEHWAGIIGQSLIPAPPVRFSGVAEAGALVVDDATRANLVAPVLSPNGDGIRPSSLFMAVLDGFDGSVLRANVVGESDFEVGQPRLSFGPTGLRLLSAFVLGTAHFGKAVVGSPAFVNGKFIGNLDSVYLNLTH